jgi:glycosyltransferase involved in cell wall biosynthesis
MILGIDASTQGSGGGRRHMIELLSAFSKKKHGFNQVKIWGVQQLLDQLPNETWLIKHTHPYLNKGFFLRTYWQLFIREKAFIGQFDVLFSPFGTYTGKIKPYITMSRNMLIFDKKERQRFGFSLSRLKFKLLFYTQKKSFENSQGIIFISKFASKEIKQQLNLSKISTRIIHHGISNDFNSKPKEQKDISEYNLDKPFRLLYVSTIWVYKHPWNVAEAVSNLRKKGYPITLDIIGSSEQGKSGKKLKKTLEFLDFQNQFIYWHKDINLNNISKHYHSANAFIFASTCENMPNILLEAMSSGLPIACSSYGPMPEFLKEGGLYFDPLSVSNIEIILEQLLIDSSKRKQIADLAYMESKDYNWQKCADETFSFLSKFINIKYNVNV